MRVIPSTADIANMEICLDWLRLVKPDDAKIIWLRAEGHRWRYVCIAAGCVRQTAWRRWVAALATIAKKVNRRRRGNTCGVSIHNRTCPNSFHPGHF